MIKKIMIACRSGFSLTIKNGVDGGTCFGFLKFAVLEFAFSRASNSLRTMSCRSFCPHIIELARLRLDSVLRKFRNPHKSELKPSPLYIKKTVTNVTVFFNVDEVTSLEPKDKGIVTHGNTLGNKYLRLISIMKQSTQEYYNMRTLLGLKSI